MVLGNWLAFFEFRLKLASMYRRRSRLRRPRRGFIGGAPLVSFAAAAEVLEVRQLLTAAVTGVTPNTGTPSGGDSVQIAGSGFSSVQAVMFGSVAAQSYTVNSTSSISAVSPSHSAGQVDIIVYAQGTGSTANSADHFTFQTPTPQVTQLGTTSGSTAGGDQVTILGNNLSGATAVYFGSTAATGIHYVDSQLTVTSPAESAGTVDVVVVTSNGYSATSSADHFTFVTPPPPAVTGIDDNTTDALNGFGPSTSGLVTGGDQVTILGNYLSGATAVYFGSTAATGLHYVNNQLTVTAPAETAATVDVVVVTPNGTSATSSADHYTFEPQPFGAQTNSPDQPFAGFVSQGAFSVSQLTGGVQATYPLLQGQGLTYSSLTADVQPIIAVDTSYGGSGIATPDSVEVHLTFGGLTANTLYFNNTGLNTITSLILADQVNASSLATGHYQYQMTVIAHYGTATAARVFTGYQDIVNRQGSEFGAGWSLAELDKLSIGSGGILWAGGSTGTAWFTDTGSGSYSSPAGPMAFSTLVKNGNGTYTLTDKLGNVENFSSTGLLTSRVDPNGNTTSYAYSSGKISTITDPFGRTTTFNYTGGLVSSITDIAGKTTSLAYTSGKLTSITAPDPDGSGPLSAPVTAYAYDSSNRMTSISDPLGNVTSLTYAFSGRLSSATFADSSTASYVNPETAGLVNTSGGVGLSSGNAATPYVVPMYPATYTDPLSLQSATTYDSFGNLLTLTDALGYTTTYTRNANGLVTQLTQPVPATGVAAPVTSYQYDSKGNLTKITYADSSYETWTYSSTLNKPLTHTDQLGHTTTNTYDSHGNLLTVTDPLGNVTTYAYNSLGLVTSVTAPNPSTGAASGGLVTTYSYDSDGRLTSLTDPLGNTTSYTYDAEGNKLTQTDPLGNVTSYTYDNLNRLISVTQADPDGSGPLAAPVTTYAYNANGQILTTTDPLGNVTRYAYDARGRLTTTTQPAPTTGGSALVTTIAYNADGLKTSVTDPLGNVTTYAYDNDGRLSSVTDPLGKTTSQIYDPLGRVIGTTDALGNLTLHGYNSVNEQTSVIDALGNVTSDTFDAAGHVLTVTQPNASNGGASGGPVTTYAYNASGQVLTKTDPLGNVTSYTYDHDGRLTSVTAPNPATGGATGGLVTSYTYDADGRKLTITDPSGNVTSYAYDADGRVTSVTASNPATGGVSGGLVTSYTYDNLSRLLTVTDALGNVSSYTYDGDGNKLTVTDALGNVTTCAYDHDGRVTSITAPNPSTGGVSGGLATTYTYNADGKVLTATDPLGNVTSYAYDADGRLTSVTAPNPSTGGASGGLVSTYTYDADGQKLTVTDPSGNVTSYTYDADGRVTSVTAPNPSTGGASGGFVTTYAYDHEGNLSSVTDQMGHTTSFTYDADGNKLTATDALGNVTSHAYDHDGRLSSVTAPNPATGGASGGLVSTFTYDADGNVLTATDPLGNVTSYAYDHGGRRTSVTQPNPSTGGSSGGLVTSYTYDANGNVLTKTDPLGNVTSYSYDADGRLISTTAPNPSTGGATGGRVATYAYDHDGNLTSVTDPLGNVTSYTYNADGNKLTATDALGNVTSYAYDHAGRLTSVTAPNPSTGGASGGLVTSYTYDADGRKLTVTDPLGNVTSYAYDHEGRLTSVTQPNPSTGGSSGGLVTSYTYDTNGNVLTKTDPLGNVTSYAYDSDGRMTSVTAPNPSTGGTSGGLVTTYAYDHDGHETSVTDPLSHTTSYTYDANGNVLTTADPLGNITTNAYDHDGHLISVTQPNPATGGATGGPVTTYTYDANGNCISETDALGNVTTYAYDHAGNLTLVTAPNPSTGGSSGGLVTSYTYDADGNKLTETDALGNVTTYAYDADGRLISTTAPNPSTGGSSGGLVTAYAYNHDGRLVTTTDPISGVTSYTYDADGNRTSLTDPDGNTTTYAYDHLNRQTGDTDANGHSDSYTYNALGDFTSKTDKDGRVTNYMYDHDGRLAYEQWMSGSTVIYTASYGYNAAGDLIGASDNSSVYVYAYNADDLATSVDNSGTPNVPRVVLALSYDSLSRLSSLSATVAGTADFLNNYTYDADGNLTQVTQQAQVGGISVTPKLVNFAYNAEGLFTTTSRYANLAATQLVATSRYGYDADGQITSLAHAKGATSLNSYTWTYDHAGRVTADSSSDGTDSYTSDASGQETAATHSYQTNESYSYDANGNRTNTGYTTGTNNEVTSDGTYNYAYDAEGNLTQKTTIATGAYVTYAWDYHNRLTDVSNYTSGGTLTSHTHYVYDIYDRLIGTQTDLTGGGTYTSSQWFVYDAGSLAGANSSPPSQGGAGGAGSNVILAYNGSGTLTDRLLVVPPSGGASANQVLADENASGAVSWLLADNEGTIRDVVQYNSGTDTTTVVDHLIYDSFGNITSQSNSAFQPLFAYTGMLLDGGSGFYYDHARWYDPQLGRFITQDPSGFAAGDADLYRYVNNSPMNATDPTGLFDWPSSFGGISAGTVAGAILNPVGTLIGGAVAGGAAMAGVDPSTIAQAGTAMTQQMQQQMNAAAAAANAAAQQAAAAAAAAAQQMTAQMNAAMVAANAAAAQAAQQVAAANAAMMAAGMAAMQAANAAAAQVAQQAAAANAAMMAAGMAAMQAGNAVTAGAAAASARGGPGWLDQFGNGASATYAPYAPWLGGVMQQGAAWAGMNNTLANASNGQLVAGTVGAAIVIATSPYWGPPVLSAAGSGLGWVSGTATSATLTGLGWLGSVSPTAGLLMSNPLFLTAAGTAIFTGVVVGHDTHSVGNGLVAAGLGFAVTGGPWSNSWYTARPPSPGTAGGTINCFVGETRVLVDALPIESIVADGEHSATTGRADTAWCVAAVGLAVSVLASDGHLQNVAISRKRRRREIDAVWNVDDDELRDREDDGLALASDNAQIYDGNGEEVAQMNRGFVFEFTGHRKTIAPDAAICREFGYGCALSRSRGLQGERAVRSGGSITTVWRQACDGATTLTDAELLGFQESPSIPHVLASAARPAQMRSRSKRRFSIATCLGLFLAFACAARGFWGSFHSAPDTETRVPRTATIATRPSVSIESIRVGQRVLTSDTANGSMGTAVDPATWRLLRLEVDAPWEDGTPDSLHVETLQSPEWVQNQTAEVGSLVQAPLDLQELGLPEGTLATVVAIEPCPQVEVGRGRVVLTTVNRLNCDVRELSLRSIDDQRESLRPTGRHRFYSEDRQEWVPASQLRAGENIRSLRGRLTVDCSRRIPGTHRVHDMTVETEHIYHVSTLGALVHNNESSGPTNYFPGQAGSGPTLTPPVIPPPANLPNGNMPPLVSTGAPILGNAPPLPTGTGGTFTNSSGSTWIRWYPPEGRGPPNIPPWGHTGPLPPPPPRPLPPGIPPNGGNDGGISPGWTLGPQPPPSVN